MREIGFLRSLDRERRIRFTDIAASDFDERAAGRSRQTLMGRIHGRLPDGSYVEGVEVSRRVYTALGLGPVVAMSRVPGVRHAMDAGCGWFAKNRLRITGRRDDGACAVPPPEVAGRAR